jgi:hypothetical protein
MLTSLTYLSTATAAFDQAALTELLAVSRRNNHAVDLSGMLLYAGGHFIQTLEGPAEQVETTFHRIGADPRHRDVIIALRDEVEERVFPDWSMGFEELPEEEAERLPGFSEFLAAKTELVQQAADLGRAGIFHRVFRDNMR